MIIDNKPNIYTLDEILELIEAEKQHGLDDGMIIVDSSRMAITIKFYENLFKLAQEEGV